MTQLSKEYFDKQLGGLEKGIKAGVKKSEKNLEKNLKSYVDKKFDDLNVRTANGFTGIQTQLSTIQRQLNDADLPQIKKDNKLIKHAISISV